MNDHSIPDADARAFAARRESAVAGIAATAVALGISELLAGILPGGRSLVEAVGDSVIDVVPGWLERAAIALLGTADKPVLIVGILLVSMLVGAGLGLLARRSVALASIGLALFAVLGVAAALGDERSAAWAVVTSGVGGAVAGIAALTLLMRAAPAPVKSRQETAPGEAGAGRRGFLQLVAVAAAVAGAAAAAGRWVTSSQRVEELRSVLRLPTPATPAPPAPPEAELALAGLTPLFTDNDEFFRIDTALSIPQVDPEQWSLEISGMVERPFTLTYEDLLAMPQVESDITLACVSNEVGGNLVGNARWQGVPLRTILEQAGVQEGATQLLSRSVDGFTAGFPVALAMEDGPLVALGMNGEPLPTVHGFPARLVVPGLYGYVSATKWLSAIELTTFEAEAGYWIPRGWSREGPIKTQSRIDVPPTASVLKPGRQAIAGVAWAPTRGIEAVEISIDEGPWQEVTLAASLDVDTWRQWFYEWDATPGPHWISVRASDGLGETQTDERAPVAPDGATGHHRVQVRVVD
ncbi:molybdopterin-dependent oxidoreductase [Tessaracoccus flavus]|uniref:molybdopterin-dependent oxidoreductase n=1 Tax=Tessaracoccus flavus TaxID=1610493 RepID=UPI00089DA273|nr:molybdopterin-dependent oxidoreductase [Tessaracoccus flavus]SDZ17806.1 DMSO/TMAO reductase YedYZ, molybdopterin-dependent catalytic subunit [Tessaracoccus flavus]